MDLSETNDKLRLKVCTVHISPGIPIWQQSQHDKSCIVVYSISILHYINVHRLVVYYHAIQENQVIESFSWIYAAVDGSEIPNNHMECTKNPVNNGIFIIYQLVIAGFMNHQRELTFHPPSTSGCLQIFGRRLELGVALGFGFGCLGFIRHGRPLAWTSHQVKQCEGLL